MSWLRKYAGLILGSIFTVFVASSIIYLWAIPVAPEVHASWSSNPTVIICPDEKLTVARVSEALDFWSDLGHDVSEVIISDQMVCSPPSRGQIVIKSGRTFSSPDPDKLGEALLTYRNEEMISVDITMLEWPWFTNTSLGKQAYDNMLRHELGHAFGYADLNQAGHVMAPHASRQGKGTEGI